MSKTMEIPLTQGYVAIVDEEDYARLSPFSWHIRKDKRTVYATRSETYPPTDKSPRAWKTFNMHREIVNCPDGFQVDHINGDGLDNRRANLRIATHAENKRNQRKCLQFRGKPTSSPYKGVHWRPCAGKWQARICFDRVRINLGHFSSEVAAARAYDAKAIEIHGAFARLNFPIEGANYASAG